METIGLKPHMQKNLQIFLNNQNQEGRFSLKEEEPHNTSLDFGRLKKAPSKVVMKT
jgi:hypothetical protein